MRHLYLLEKQTITPSNYEQTNHPHHYTSCVHKCVFIGLEAANWESVHQADRSSTCVRSIHALLQAPNNSSLGVLLKIVARWSLALNEVIHWGKTSLVRWEMKQGAGARRSGSLAADWSQNPYSGGGLSMVCAKDRPHNRSYEFVDDTRIWMVRQC